MANTWQKMKLKLLFFPPFFSVQGIISRPQNVNNTLHATREQNTGALTLVQPPRSARVALSASSHTCTDETPADRSGSARYPVHQGVIRISTLADSSNRNEHCTKSPHSPKHCTTVVVCWWGGGGRRLSCCRWERERETRQGRRHRSSSAQ